MPALPPNAPRPSRLQISNLEHHRRRRRNAIIGIAIGVVVLVGLIGFGVKALAGGDSSKSSKEAKAAAAKTAAQLNATTPESTKLAAEQKLGEKLAARSKAEHKAVSDTLARMPFVAVAGRQHRQVALTFDDGPGPFTPGVVKVLRRLHVPATFFQVGGTLHYFTEGETEATRGNMFVVGNHTVNHANMGKLKAAEQAKEIDENQKILTAAGAIPPQLFRPPYGSFDQTTLKQLRQRGMLMVFWTVDSQDYSLPGAEAIVRNVVDKVRPGAIVLMHDAGGDRSQTIAALPSIVRKLRKRGYKFVTVPKLLLDNPAPDKQPPVVPGVG